MPLSISFSRFSSRGLMWSLWESIAAGKIPFRPHMGNGKRHSILRRRRLCHSATGRIGIIPLRMLEIPFGLRYGAGVKVRTLLAIVAVTTATVLLAQDSGTPSIADFPNVTQGRYQVFSQGGRQLGVEVSRFMNAILGQYEKLFNNLSIKDGARVIVF